MIILSLRTDKVEAEIGLFDGNNKLAYITWEAHRTLAETLHSKINEMLQSQSLRLADVTGVIVYEGPGSFTGLRIGVSVANSIAYSNSIPIVSATGDTWIKRALQKIQKNNTRIMIVPNYGMPPHITAPKL